MSVLSCLYHLRLGLLIGVFGGSLPSALAQENRELRERASVLLGTVAAVSEEEVHDPGVTLGQALFWDMRLSRNGKTACASCHYRENHGADRRTRSLTARGGRTALHAMTVFNTQVSELGLRWFADRASGQAQALGSITGSMGFDEREDLLPLLAELDYEAQFKAAFPDSEEPLSTAHYGAALEAYQRSLRTPAPFDAWLQGEDAAMTKEQTTGLKHFLDLGCAGCHNGPLLGAGQLQRFGIHDDYWLHTGSEERHEGLQTNTGREEDRYVFRVATLRNVAATPPYFHDGSVSDLGAAVAIMARVQLGRTLTDDEVSALAAFLSALSGPLPVNFHAPEGVPFSLPEDLP